MARRRQMNSMVVLLLVGLIAGAFIGYLTRPQSAEIRLGPVNIEVQSDRIARGGEITSGQAQHIALLALIGAVLGLGLGFASKRGKIGF